MRSPLFDFLPIPYSGNTHAGVISSMQLASGS
jgi:hypothetical protein